MRGLGMLNWIQFKNDIYYKYDNCYTDFLALEWTLEDFESRLCPFGSVVNGSVCLHGNAAGEDAATPDFIICNVRTSSCSRPFALVMCVSYHDTYSLMS